MKISVIIPTYKPQGYLWECLNSLCTQTLQKDDYEIIIVLNGCKNPYYIEIWQFLNEHPDINWRFIQTDIGGVSNARNIGIQESQGEYVTFVDDDDYVSNTYLESILSVSSKNTIGFAHPVAFDERGNLPYSIEAEFKKIYEQGNVPYLAVRKIFQGPCMKLFHKDVIGKRRFNVRYKNGEDALFMFLISNKFKMVCATKEDAIYYRRIRHNSAAYTKQRTSYKIKNCISLIISYSSIFWSHLGSYNLSFYSTRILGAIRMAIH